jgi:superfamily II RNA helicase
MTPEVTFPFELSPFQVDAIEAIKKGEHCLVTAHTGSGKTVPAEFAIQYFTALGKRVIYTSPIKALSNQKLHDFREKYPHISFGIVTGDIEDNKEAQVLIMTTEILSNSLLNRTMNAREESETESNPLRFDMDYENDLAAVVFDEVHYISDAARGQAWEQSMMLLPRSVVYVMLSATIANPYILVNWVKNVTEKEVCLASTMERVVPLKHYVYTPQFPEKKLKSMLPDTQAQVNEIRNKLTLIKEGEGQTFNQSTYSSIHNVFTRHMGEQEPYRTIPDLIRKLKSKDMLPVLIFVFSRNETMTLAEKLCASGIPSLFDEGTVNVRGTIERECRHLLSKKIPNYEDFLDSPDLQRLIMCLSKGVAYHHAGMMPILRELVEFLDTKGYVRVLFATETFAVGVNMPTRTVVFTRLSKFTEDGQRMLHPHEYTQMAGRAGRRGLDTVGHCIILSPELATPGSLAMVLTGRPATITSNYRISYHLVLGCLVAAEAKGDKLTYEELVQQSVSYSHNSLSAPGKLCYVEKLNGELKKKQAEMETVRNQCQQTKTPVDIIEKYKSLNNKLSSGMLTNKMVKSCKREVYKLLQDNFCLERDYEIMKAVWNCEADIREKESEISEAEGYVMNEVKSAVYVLIQLGFISVTSNSDENLDTCAEIMTASNYGKFAMSIYEAHPLGMAMAVNELFGFYSTSNATPKEDAIDLVKFLSVFCDIKANKWNNPKVSEEAKFTLDVVNKSYATAYDTEAEGCDNGRFYISRQFETQGILYELAGDWCYCETNEECKKVLQSAYDNANISTGDFVKALMKIIKLSKELMAGAEQTGELSMVAVCKEVPQLLLKYIVTSYSLYV